MRLLVCGSRDWTDDGEIAVQMGTLFDPLSIPHRVVIHGGNGSLITKRGADVLAGWVALGFGARVFAYPATYEKDGPWPAAGPKRNARMLREGKPDQGLAFGPLYRSEKGRERDTTGTGNMVMKMLRIRLPVRWVPAPREPAQDLTAMPAPPVYL